MNIGTNPFHGENYCRDTSVSIIGNDSCYGRKACMGVDGIIIGYGSCWDTGCDARDNTNNVLYEVYVLCILTYL
jgi:hypothetical protein